MLRDDDLYQRFIESVCHEDQQYAHEAEDGVIEVVFARDGDLGRAKLLITRLQLRGLASAGNGAPDDSVADDHPGERLQTVTASADEALSALRFDEPFVVLFDGRFVGSTRRELPPVPGSPEPFGDVEDGFSSAYASDDPRFGEPGSIFGSRPGGESDQLTLIVSMSPVLDQGRYLFCEVEHDSVDVQPLVQVREEQATTVVVDQDVADEHGWDYATVNAMVTLPVHSAAGAVDLTAEITGALAERGLSCRVVAGLRNDRLFVAHDRGWDVLQALEDLRDAATGTAFTQPGDQ